MWEYLIEYIELAILIALVLILLISLRILLQNRFISMHFSNKKFNIQALYLIDPNNKEERFRLNIFNNNFNDARVVGFGFLYNNQSIDYFNHYLEDHKTSKKNSAVIQTRSSIKIDIDKNNLIDVIKHYSDGRRQIFGLEAFVIDALGMTTKVPANEISTVINRQLKAEDDALREKRREALRQERAERRKREMEKRQLNRQRRKEKRARLLMKIKKIRFRKKKDK